MRLEGLDLAIVFLTLAGSLAIGLGAAKRGRRDLTSYLVAGRTLPWWLAGTSLVATSFAADTPLAIARIVRTQGLAGNWFWWSHAIGFLACALFFAPLWRRAEVLTDAEVIELRYEGRDAAGLRAFLAVYRGVVANAITLGWVLLGMQKICGEAFGWPPLSTTAVLFSASLVYTVASGLWGVVLTDFVQFVLAMTGSVALMIAVYAEVGGPSGLAEGVLAAAASGVPGLASASTVLDFGPAGALGIATFTFYLTVQWWGSVEGGGFLAQRLFATRDERQATLALLWFCVAHFGLRTWPWVIVGLGSLVLLPDLADPESAYPRLMVALLPPGVLGIAVAALLAAFLSTASTHLNWGASYLVSDLWKRFVRPGGDGASDVRVAQVCVVLTMALAALAASLMDSIWGAWLYLSELGAGAIVAGILRWAWWRMTARAEIAALVASLLTSNALRLLPSLAGEAAYPLRFVLVVAVGTIVTIAVARAGAAVPDDRAVAFYRRVRPWGAWGAVAERCPEVTVPRLGWAELRTWLALVVVLYAVLFGLGALALGRTGLGAVLLLGAGSTLTAVLLGPSPLRREGER